MIENNSVSRAAFDQSRANRDAARARLNAARSRVEGAKEQLEYTVIRAPYAGIVSKRHVELGELVSPGQPVISGLSLQSLRVNVDVPQSMFHAIRTIGKAFVYVKGERIAAESLTFFPVADAEANTFRVRVNLAEAVVRRSELSGVYVADGDAVALRQVRLGRRYGDSIEVLSGLSEGEAVAIDPVAAGIWLKEQVQ
jgi:multidrug efflux pump subunit AcrA (membrane-fusion protein)